MHPNLRRGHDALWRKFFCEENGLIYDVEITDPAQLPTAEEVAASVPNCSGWGTGMEDCALTGGFVLDGMVTAHRVTGEAEWAEKARRIFSGLVTLGTVSRTRGFVARGVAPGRTDNYPNSSADQFTSFVYGVWRYGRSAIATDEERATATGLLVDIARLVESFNDDIPRDDMRPSIYGDTSDFEPGRACRLLEFYKAAHDLSGDAHWQEVYMQKVEADDRARVRSHYGPEVWDLSRNIHCVNQSQGAFRLLYEAETDADLKDAYRKALDAEALSVIGRIPLWREIVARPLRQAVPPRWREFWPGFVATHPGYDVSRIEGVREWFHYCREQAEKTPVPGDVLAHARPALPWLRHQTEALGTVMLCEDAETKRRAAEEGWPMLTEVDWSLVAEAGVWECLDLAWWHGVEAGVFASD